MNAKVIPLWRPRTFTSAEAMLDEVRTHLSQDKRTNHAIANVVGVAPGTVYNITSGKTRWPRPTTLFPLLHALGLELQVVPKRST